MPKRHGVILNGPDVTTAPAQLPMHGTIFVLPITPDGRLSPMGPNGLPIGIQASSMGDFLQKAKLSHDFELELEEEKFPVHIEIDSMKSLDPDEIQTGTGAQDGLGRLRRRRDALSRMHEHLQKRPSSGRFVRNEAERKAAIEALRTLARLVRGE